jgi:hypothetical protein
VGKVQVTCNSCHDRFEAPPAFRTPGFVIILRGCRHFLVLVHDFLRGLVSECGVKTRPIIAQLYVACDVFRCFPACRVHGAVGEQWPQGPWWLRQLQLG